jgi:hypothetical protein
MTKNVKMSLHCKGTCKESCPVLKQALCIEDIWGSGGIAPCINISNSWGEWSALHPNHFIPWEKASSTL